MDGLFTISGAAAELGCTRYVLHHALAGDGRVGERVVEEVEVTPELLERLDLTKRTKRLVRVREFTEQCITYDPEDDTPEASMARLYEISRNPDASPKMQMDALVALEKRRDQIAERSRAFIERELVEAAMATVCNCARDELSATPARFAGELFGLDSIDKMRARFVEIVDDVLTRLGDRVERELTELGA